MLYANYLATKDLLKITVVNRYREAPPAVAFIKNFGLKHGALASTVGHDCHNIIAVGVDEVVAVAGHARVERRGQRHVDDLFRHERLRVAIDVSASQVAGLGFDQLDLIKHIERLRRHMRHGLESDPCAVGQPAERRSVDRAGGEIRHLGVGHDDADLLVLRELVQAVEFVERIQVALGGGQWWSIISCLAHGGVETGCW